MHQKLIVFAVATLAVCLVLTCGLSLAKAQTTKPEKKRGVRLVTREVSLGRAHPGEIEDTRTLSRDGRRLAFVVGVSGGESVFVDGKPGKTYRQIARDPFSESPSPPDEVHKCQT